MYGGTLRKAEEGGLAEDKSLVTTEAMESQLSSNGICHDNRRGGQFVSKNRYLSRGTNKYTTRE